MLANAMAMAGNCECDSKVSKDAKVQFAPVDVNSDYADHALRATLWRDGGQREMVAWMRGNDLYLRTGDG